MKAAKQNQKFPFHFLSAPPTPPAELNQKGRKIFGFCPRESASAADAQSKRTIQSRATTRSARATLVGILLEMGSDFFKQTPPKLISCLARGFAPRFGRHFRKEMPRVSEIHRQDSRRKAAVPKRSLDCAKGAKADERFSKIVGVSATLLSI